MIIVITGPTGVGKTKMSIALAKKYQAEIINGDSIQIYKGMDTGSAKVTASEKENIPHYLFDICDYKDNYTIYDYQKAAREIIDKNKDRTIIMVGGSGLYQKAALYDYDLSEEDENTETYDDLTNDELYLLSLEKDYEAIPKKVS